jgi:hypothetical protein
MGGVVYEIAAGGMVPGSHRAGSGTVTLAIREIISRIMMVATG